MVGGISLKDDFVQLQINALSFDILCKCNPLIHHNSIIIVVFQVNLRFCFCFLSTCLGREPLEWSMFSAGQTPVKALSQKMTCCEGLMS